jgi:hypothetical protein
MMVGRPLFDFVQKHDSSIVVCDSETCRWQIKHATEKSAIHPIELLSGIRLSTEEPLQSSQGISNIEVISADNNILSHKYECG